MYYAAYAALRPDKQWRLVSHPYYAKYAKEGDNTYFRPINKVTKIRFEYKSAFREFKDDTIQ
jgi:hypothetical protein